MNNTIYPKELQSEKSTPWHHTMWGKIILFIICLVLIFILYFVYQLVSEFKKLTQPQQNVNAIEKSLENVSVDAFDLSQKQVAVQRIVESSDDPFVGPINAPITIVEYFDVKCHQCKRAHDVVKKILSEYPQDIRLIYRDMPLITSESPFLALVGECFHEQGRFVEFIDEVYSRDVINIADMNNVAQDLGLDISEFRACVQEQRYEAEVDADLRSGIKAGVTGTPTFFINGHKVAGAIPYEIFEQIIDTTLTNTKSK